MASFFIDIINSNYGSVLKKFALRGLIKAVGKNSRPYLKLYIKDSKQPLIVQRDAIRALGKFGNQEDVKFLSKLINENQIQKDIIDYTLDVIRSLKGLPAKEQDVYLNDLILSKNQDVDTKKHAIIALVKEFKAKSFDYLKIYIEDKSLSLNIRKEAISSVAQFADKREVEYLEKLIKEEKVPAELLVIAKGIVNKNKK